MGISIDQLMSGSSRNANVNSTSPEGSTTEEIARRKRKREMDLAERGIFGAKIDWNIIDEPRYLTGELSVSDI